jgi:hypothetical protein
MVWWLVALASAACERAVPTLAPLPRAPVSEGIDIALLVEHASARAWVDERRWVDVKAGEVVLDHLPNKLELATLTVEAVESTLALDGCVRAAGEPSVRCRVRGNATGRHFVRLGYALPTPVEVVHDVVINSPATATLTSTFKFTAGATSAGASVAAYGRSRAVLATGRVALDGNSVTVAVPAREIAIRNVTVYAPQSGAENPKPMLIAYLELVGARTVAGSVHVQRAGAVAKLATVASTEIVHRTGAAAIALGEDTALVASRRINSDRVRDRIEIAITNNADDSREVRVEEKLRANERRTVERAPAGVKIVDHVLYHTLTIAPKARVELEFVLSYQGARVNAKS